MNLSEKSDIIAAVLEYVVDDDLVAAGAKLASEYPSPEITPKKRKSWTKGHILKIAERDGFIDRYSGQKLVYPAALKLLSLKLQDDFPYHPNWKMSETHIAVWEFYPTLDHIDPIARGGRDDDDNIVLTSMVRNGAKLNFTLEELNWKLYDKGDISNWDGLLGMTTRYLEEHPDLLQDANLQRWHKAQRAVFSTG